MGNLFGSKSNKQRKTSSKKAKRDELRMSATTHLPFKLNEWNNCSQFDGVLSVERADASLRQCLFGQSDQSLCLFDHEQSRVVRSWPLAHERDITRVLYCERTRHVLSASRDKTVKMWHEDADESKLTMDGHELVVTSIAVNAENTRLVSGSRDNKLNLWDLESGQLITSAAIPRNLITEVDWSTSGQQLILQSGEDKETRVWDASSLQLVFAFAKKQYIQSSCQFSSCGNYAITASNGFQGQGCEITIWDMRERAMVSELCAHEQTVTCVRVASSDRIVSCSNDGTMRLWDIKTSSLLDTLYLSNGLTSISKPKSVPDNTWLVSSLSSGLFTILAT